MNIKNSFIRIVKCFSLPGIFVAPLITSCAAKPKDTCISWTGLKTQPYVPTYPSLSEQEVKLDDTLPNYLSFAQHNCLNYISQDLVATISRDNFGDPSLTWTCTSETYKVNTSHNLTNLDYYVDINGQDNLYFSFSLKVTNLEYYPIILNTQYGDKLAFLPKNILFDEDKESFETTDEFWSDPNWQIYLVYYEKDSDQPSDITFSYKTMLYDDKEKLNDYLRFLVIYPHYYENCEVIN